MPEISDQDYRTYLRLQDIASKYDGPDGITRKISALEGDVAKERDKRKEAEAKVPGDGAVVLTGDEAKAYPALKEIGALGAPTEIKGKLDRVDEVEAKLKARERRDAVAAAVKAQGWADDTIETLLDLRSLDGAQFEVKREKVKKDGKDEELEVAYVTLAGEGAKAQKLTEFAESTPSLKGLKTTASGTPPNRWQPQPQGDPAKIVNPEEKQREATARTARYDTL
jgi:hypothetical protein